MGSGGGVSSAGGRAGGTFTLGAVNKEAGLSITGVGTSGRAGVSEWALPRVPPPLPLN